MTPEDGFPFGLVFQILGVILLLITCGFAVLAAIAVHAHRQHRKEVQDPVEEVQDPVAVWFGSGTLNCFDCGEPLLLGPRGGCGVNAGCTTCGAEFNICGPLSHRLAEPGCGRVFQQHNFNGDGI